MNKYHVKNSNGTTVTTKATIKEARAYLQRKGDRHPTGVMPGWYVHVEQDGPRIVSQEIVDRETGTIVESWPWSIAERSNDANPAHPTEARLASIDYATREVEYLNSLVGYGRYVLIDILGTIH